MQSLICLTKTVEIIADMAGILVRQRQELQSDRICGHWLGLDTNHSVTIIRNDDGYLISFFREGHIGEQVQAILYKNEVQIINLPDEVQDTKISLFDNDNRLVVGKYGTFIRDHVLGCTSSGDTRMKRSKKYKQ
jgi:hypothetical protein